MCLVGQGCRGSGVSCYDKDLGLGTGTLFSIQKSRRRILGRIVSLVFGPVSEFFVSDPPRPCGFGATPGPPEGRTGALLGPARRDRPAAVVGIDPVRTTSFGHRSYSGLEGKDTGPGPSPGGSFDAKPRSANVVVPARRRGPRLRPVREDLRLCGGKGARVSRCGPGRRFVALPSNHAHPCSGTLRAGQRCVTCLVLTPSNTLTGPSAPSVAPERGSGVVSGGPSEPCLGLRWKPTVATGARPSPHHTETALDPSGPGASRFPSLPTAFPGAGVGVHRRRRHRQG